MVESAKTLPREFFLLYGICSAPIWNFFQFQNRSTRLRPSCLVPEQESDYCYHTLNPKPKLNILTLNYNVFAQFSTWASSSRTRQPVPELSSNAVWFQNWGKFLIGENSWLGQNIYTVEWNSRLHCCYPVCKNALPAPFHSKNANFLKLYDIFSSYECVVTSTPFPLKINIYLIICSFMINIIIKGGREQNNQVLLLYCSNTYNDWYIYQISLLTGGMHVTGGKRPAYIYIYAGWKPKRVLPSPPC